MGRKEHDANIRLWASPQAVQSSATHLEVSQLRECVHDDTKDDVEADSGDEDEEGQVENDQKAKLEECVFCRMTGDALCMAKVPRGDLNISHNVLDM